MMKNCDLNASSDLSGELLEARVLETVSTLFDSKLAPLFQSVLESSTTLSTAVRVSEQNGVARARAQNARIEEVEASNQRGLERVEERLASETAAMKRSTADTVKKLETMTGDALREGLVTLSQGVAVQVRAEVERFTKELQQEMLASPKEARKSSSQPVESARRTELTSVSSSTTT
ncbi:hypothetical protein JCM11491_000799 [Sporobolomyces phaffii]